MPVVFPGDCDTPAKKVEWCYAAMSQLHVQHNLMGKWRRGELLQAEYDTLTPNLRADYIFNDHQPFLPEALFKQFKNTTFYPKEKLIIDQLNTNRDLLRQSVAWPVDLDSI